MSVLPASSQTSAARGRPDLPLPSKPRWEPLRSGLFNLYHYDYEEFRYEQGHLLLRGNNGTGKSRVLALQLPFLLDGEVAAHRLEPDGDPAKRVEWNLLLGKHRQRLGYTWIEFGRRDQQGEPHYVTLGCGLSAVEGRGLVGKWFFVTHKRIGEDLFLQGNSGRPLGRDALTSLLEAKSNTAQQGAEKRERAEQGEQGEQKDDGGEKAEQKEGAVYGTAAAYRRAVDAALFRLGEQRYEALVNLLIRLRQPQLSRKLDETKLSQALSDALPPVSGSMLDQVAEAFRSLESDHDALEGYRATAEAASNFLREYRRYAQIAARRRAAELRSRHSAYEAQQRRLREAEEQGRAAHHSIEEVEAQLEQLGGREAQFAQVVRTLEGSPEMRDARQLEQARRETEERLLHATRAETEYRHSERACEAALREHTEARASVQEILQRVAAVCQQAAGAARGADLDSTQARVLDRLGLPEAREDADVDAAAAWVEASIEQRRRAAARLRELERDAAKAEGVLVQAKQRRDDVSSRLDEAVERQQRSHTRVDQLVRTLLEGYRAWFGSLKQLAPLDPDVFSEQVAEWRLQPEQKSPLRPCVQAARDEALSRIAERREDLAPRRRDADEALALLCEERTRLEAGHHEPPPAPHHRGRDARLARLGAPLWQLCDFAPHVSQRQRAGLEAALEAAGLLDAWVTPDGELLRADEHDTVLIAGRSAIPAKEHPLASALVARIDAGDDRASRVGRSTVETLLAQIGLGSTAGSIWVDDTGQWQVGPLHGRWAKRSAQHIGQGAREAARRARLAELVAKIHDAQQLCESVARQARALDARERTARQEAESAPDLVSLERALTELETLGLRVHREREYLAEADGRIATQRSSRDQTTRTRDAAAQDLHLAGWLTRLDELEAAISRYREATQGLWPEVRHLLEARRYSNRAAERLEGARREETLRRDRSREARERAEAAAAHRDTLQSSVGSLVAEILARLEQAKLDLQEVRDSRDRCRSKRSELEAQRIVAEERTKDRRADLERVAGERETAFAALRLFAGTQLLSIALPEEKSEAPGEAGETAEQPRASAGEGNEEGSAEGRDPRGARPGPSVTRSVELARRIEAALRAVESDDATWERNESNLLHHVEALSQALLPRGYPPEHRRQHGLSIVSVSFQGKETPMIELEKIMREEVAERRAILDAREREVLENHLKNEIATHLHERLHAAEELVQRMNREISSRPTSTGMSLRFVWRVVDDGPAGLAEARRRLLAAGETWSPEERRAIGEFLQQRIREEREANDTATWQEQLAAAFDYRAWHRFTVERRQDGQWKRLTRRTHGTGSGGEKAIALTIPQFAAAAAHYSSAHPHAPRLILLDEAFVGVDADMRSKCMGLLEAFDLDFVMTSEREWGCYPTLGGVAIYQLATRAGIDAVAVTRWVWNGERRFRDTPRLPTPGPPDTSEAHVADEA